MLTTRRLLSLARHRTLSTCHRTSASPPPSLSPAPATSPPVAKKVPFTVSVHGLAWDDPYHWMSKTNDPHFVEHLARENAYAEYFMADAIDLRRSLVEEMRSRMPASVSTPPEQWGPWLYYQYIPEGKEYPVLCRRMRQPGGFTKELLRYFRGFWKEQTLLDWNDIAEKFGYVHIGTCRVSPDHKFLAYTLDSSGSEFFVLYVKDIESGDLVPYSTVEGVVSVAWAAGSSCLLYTSCDDTQRPHRVYAKTLGSKSADILLFTESDTSCCVDITSTKDGKFITINSNSRTSSEEGVYN